MPRQQTGETSKPVVIALAFFVLTSLALGVLTYLAYDDMAKLREDAKKAGTEKEAALSNQTKSDEKLLLYKVALGVASEEERTNLQNMRAADAVREEWQKLQDGLAQQVAAASQQANRSFVGGGGGAFSVDAGSVFKWDWPQGGKLAAAPNKAILDQMVAIYAAQQLGQRQTNTQQAQLQEAKDQATKAKEAYDAEAAKLKTELAALPGRIQAEVKKYEQISEEARKLIQDDTKAYTEAKRKFEADKAQLELDAAKLKEDIRKQNLNIERMQSELEPREDPFEFDKPHGKIVRRRPDGSVEIDLGTAANVKPGLKFSVQPSDTPQRGFSSRKRMVGGQMQVVAKGKLEVIQTLGPNLSQARIIEENDRIRDSIIAGDLLYNSVWRRGEPDHIALAGVFDTNGDGNDDIKTIARDLTRMGIVVDAYWDLDQGKWLSPNGGPGRITERTIYMVEGYTPFQNSSPGEPEPVMAAKAAIRDGIAAAKKEAKDRGTKVVRMRDFFPRIGYPVNLDVDETRVNQAGGRYLKTPAAGTEPPAM